MKYLTYTLLLLFRSLFQKKTQSKPASISDILPTPASAPVLTASAVDYVPPPPSIPVPPVETTEEPVAPISPVGSPHFLVTRAEILMGRDKEYPLTPEFEKNLSKLLVNVNKLRQIWGQPLVVTSGYRPGYYNTRAGGAENSTHLSCEAVDFLDKGQKLGKWLEANPDILRECGLFLENPKYTRTWVHVDIRPRSNRVFNP